MEGAMRLPIARSVLRTSQHSFSNAESNHLWSQASFPSRLSNLHRSVCTRQVVPSIVKRAGRSHDIVRVSKVMVSVSKSSPKGMHLSLQHQKHEIVPIELQLFQSVWDRHELGRKKLGVPAFPSKYTSDSYCTFASFSDGSTETHTHCLRSLPEVTIDWEELNLPEDELPERLAWKEIYLQGADGIAEPTLTLDQLTPEDREAFTNKVAGKHIYQYDPCHPSKRSLKKQTRITTKKELRRIAIAATRAQPGVREAVEEQSLTGFDSTSDQVTQKSHSDNYKVLMTSETSVKPTSESQSDSSPARHRPLVVGLKKPSSQTATMASSDAAAALNHEIQKNVDANTKAAAPAGESAESSQPKQKKEKAPKQPKPPKAAPAAAPTSPALIDLRVGHILRAINHPNADSLYVSTIAMGDPEGTEHTQVDEETGKVVRTVCSGLNGLVPLEEMQNRKIIVVANLKPVNMRSIKSAAMVLAASPKQEEGADPHAADRVVELVIPPEGSEAGDKVYFEGWPYGEGKGPEKQLNPKKKQWEAIQPGFYTGDDLVVGFDAANCDEVTGSEKGNLVVEGKGVCKVKTLKGATVR